MKIINVLSNDLKLVREQNRLSIYSNTEKLVSYPLSYFDGIFCFSNISITTPLIKFLSANNKYIAFFSSTGRLNSLIFPLEKQSGLSNRLKQFEFYTDEEKNIRFCKVLIDKKLQEIERCFQIDTTSYRRKLIQATSKESILGIEGTASASMFKVFSEMLGKIGIQYKGRDYFPPTDEVNSILSFAYSYFYNCATAILYMKGFDPYIGIMHSKRGQHYAFASDIIEVIRPYITLSVYSMIKEIGLQNIQFTKSDKAIYIEKSSLTKIIVWLNSNIFDKQISQINRFLNEMFEVTDSLTT